jgi:hypothetical protein
MPHYIGYGSDVEALAVCPWRSMYFTVLYKCRALQQTSILLAQDGVCGTSHHHNEDGQIRPCMGVGKGGGRCTGQVSMGDRPRPYRNLSKIRHRHNTSLVRAQLIYSSHALHGMPPTKQISRGVQQLLCPTEWSGHIAEHATAVSIDLRVEIWVSCYCHEKVDARASGMLNLFHCNMNCKGSVGYSSYTCSRLGVLGGA